MDEPESRGAILDDIELQLRHLARKADAIGEALLPYLIEQAAVEARKARERRERAPDTRMSNPTRPIT